MNPLNAEDVPVEWGPITTGGMCNEIPSEARPRPRPRVSVPQDLCGDYAVCGVR